MKQLTIAITLLSVLAVRSQSLNVEQYQLDNGLKVYLNPDPTATKVFGAVWVNAGSKQDPADATGIAHYLEHMLFKGTTELGTQDYASEKVHLDSIKALYDQLGQTTDEDRRASIQRAINQQEVQAANYAIPNEFDQLLKSIGGTGVNASTSQDYTNYYNFLPANQISKWLHLYAHRFQEPVFRLFQSELETVYEEKNRANDDLERRVFENFNKHIYGNHPYSTQTTLGTADHLKNPSLSKMYEYFNTYYVANNMALILTGNFEPEAVKPDIEKTFGQLRSGEVPAFPEYDLGAFEGRQVEKVRITPIKAEFIGYKLVPRDHPDRPALDVIGAMISNEGGTGFIDELMLNDEVMFAGAFQEYLDDDGSTFIFLVPKLVGKGLKKWEAQIRAELASIAEGSFDDAYFDAIKNGRYKQFQLSLEDLGSRSWNIGLSFISDIAWETVLEYPQRIKALTIEDIKRAAAQYYGDDYFVMQSRTGFPKKDKIKKPPYKPIAARTSEKSAFAEQFESMQDNPTEPRFIDFEKDVQLLDDYVYYSDNPVNDIFTLRLNIARGTDSDPMLSTVAQAMDASGTFKYGRAELKRRMAEMGASLSASADDNSFNIVVTGLDGYLAEIVGLVVHSLEDFHPTKQTVEYLTSQRKTDTKISKQNPSTGGSILYRYGSYGDHSRYKNRIPIKELKKLPSETLKSKLSELLQNGFTSIHYTGTVAPSEVLRILRDRPLLKRNTLDDYTYRPANSIGQNTILLLHDKKAIQSYTYYVVNGEPLNYDDYFRKEAFDAYYTNSLMFQEVREFRSLAYSTGGAYVLPTYEPEKPGKLVLFTGSQADKTVDAVEVVLDLINDMPVYEERLETIRNGLQLSSVTERPDFRNLPVSVETLIQSGFTSDPKEAAYEAYNDMNFDDIVKFYETNVKGRPIMVTIYGDTSRFDIDRLRKLGKVVEVKWADVVTP